MLCWFEVIVAYVTQGAMFLLFIAMPITGYLSLAAAGKPVSLFGVATIPTLVLESGSLSQAAIALHLLGEILIYGLVALHISAALMHGFIRRDGILERMLSRRSP
jgi:cytochrome b561